MSIFTLYHVYSPNRVKLTLKYKLSDMTELTLNYRVCQCKNVQSVQAISLFDCYVV